MRVVSGGSVYFNINSFDKYENGLEYSNWTRLSVSFLDTTDAGDVSNKKWRLTVEAMTTNIKGNGTNTLPLNTIEIAANCADATDKPTVALSAPSSAVEIVDEGANNVSTSLVNITYYCGQSKTITNTLLGKSADFYTVDIVITLEGDPETSP